MNESGKFKDTKDNLESAGVVRAQVRYMTLGLWGYLLGDCSGCKAKTTSVFGKHSHLFESETFRPKDVGNNPYKYHKIQIRQPSMDQFNLSPDAQSSGFNASGLVSLM
jgi:hypothetical protein